MEASTETVVINFVGDTQGLQPVEDSLHGIISAGDEVAQKWKKTSDAMNNANKSNLDSTSKVAKAITDLNNATKSMDKVVIGGAYKQYLKQIQDQLGLTQKELIKYVENARKAAQEHILTEADAQEVEQLSLSIQVMNEQLAEMGAAEDEAGQKTVSLRTRIKQAKDELVAMAEAGLAGTPAFVELQQHAGDLQDEFNDLNQTIKGLGSDTRHIDGLISLASGVAGGFAVAQGSAALFGSENEEVQKALLKVNAAMSILQGLQQVQNVLQKESAASLLFQTSATKGATVATEGLNVAMKANPVGLVILGVTALITALSFFADSEDEASKKTKQLNDDLIDQRNLAKELDDTLKDSFGTGLAKISQEVAIASVNGTSKLKQLGLGLDEIRQKQFEAQEAFRKTDGFTSYYDLKSQLSDVLLQLQRYRGELDKDQLKEKENLENRKKDLQQQYNEQKKIVDDYVSLNKEAAVKEAEIQQERKEIRKRNLQAIFEIEQRHLERISEIQKQVLDSSPAEFYNIRVAALERYTNAQAELFDKQRRHELAAVGLTETEKENIEDKYTQAVIKLNQDKDLKLEQLLLQRNAAIKKANAEAVADEKELYNNLVTDAANHRLKVIEDLKKGIDQIYDKLKTGNADEESSELEKLKKQYDLGLLTTQQYEFRRAEIKRDFEIRDLDNEKSRLEALIQNLKAKGEVTTQYEQQLDAVKDQIRQRELEKEKGHTEQLIQEFQKRTGRIKEILDLLVHSFQEGLGTTGFTVALSQIENLGFKAADVFQKLHDHALTSKEAIQELKLAAAESLQAVIAQSFADSAAARQQELQETLDNLEQQKQKELSNKNLTEQQKAEIEKRYKNQERQEKLRAWEADKDAKKQMALINGFVAFTAALPNFFLAGAALVAAGLQVVAINNTKPPKFRHGEIDINGPGTSTSDSIPAFISKGESVINAEATARWKDALIAINDNRFDDYLTKRITDFVFPDVPADIQTMVINKNGGIDYEKLAEAVATKMAAAIPKQKILQINTTLDSEGHTTHILEEHRRTEIKNRHFSMEG